MKDSRKQALIAEEAFMVETSGEIPEVAMHSSIYYLTQAFDGPALQLDSEDILPLKEAVVKRYRVIILRDLDPGNRDKSKGTEHSHMGMSRDPVGLTDDLVDRSQ